MMNPYQLQLCDKELDAWFENHKQLTSLDFKNHMRVKYPGLEWNQSPISAYLSDKDSITFSPSLADVIGYRIYTRAPQLKLTKEMLFNVVKGLSVITKVAAKKELKSKGISFTLDEFNNLFDELNLTKVSYNQENHLVYQIPASGIHISSTKDEAMDISTMAKPYLKNTIHKLFREVKVRQDFLDDPNSEIVQLLRAYFLYEVRKTVQ